MGKKSHAVLALFSVSLTRLGGHNAGHGLANRLGLGFHGRQAEYLLEVVKASLHVGFS